MWSSLSSFSCLWTWIERIRICLTHDLHSSFDSLDVFLLNLFTEKFSVFNLNTLSIAVAASKGQMKVQKAKIDQKPQEQSSFKAPCPNNYLWKRLIYLAFQDGTQKRKYPVKGSSVGCLVKAGGQRIMVWDDLSRRTTGPLLSAENWKLRLCFTLAGQKWTVEVWENVAWSGSCYDIQMGPLVHTESIPLWPYMAASRRITSHGTKLKIYR